ncbi:hypothetical protein ACFOW1_15225 [Parasediminibacterium paludis]|uniref:Uncharacterized protein n=1 Tax=Parasediminibacterium paludis TaxID=908966 RepID=A0ABV8PZ61_9BACT
MLGSINNSAFTAMGVTVTASMTTLPIGSWYFIENGTTSGTISVKLSSPDKSSTETYTINYTVQ